MLDLLKKKYTPETLPFHAIVPSLPGYGYTNGPPLDKNFDTEGMSRVLDKLMIGLGFGDGYVAQGGDIGSFISRILAVTSDSCKAAHLNLVIGLQGETDGLSDAEKKGVQRIVDFVGSGHALLVWHTCSHFRQPWEMPMPVNMAHDRPRLVLYFLPVQLHS